MQKFVVGRFFRSRKLNSRFLFASDVDGMWLDFSLGPASGVAEKAIQGYPKDKI